MQAVPQERQPLKKIRDREKRGRQKFVGGVVRGAGFDKA